MKKGILFDYKVANITGRGKCLVTNEKLKKGFRWYDYHPENIVKVLKISLNYIKLSSEEEFWEYVQGKSRRDIQRIQ